LTGAGGANLFNIDIHRIVCGFTPFSFCFRSLG